jgi:hypothetical protein
MPLVVPLAFPFAGSVVLFKTIWTPAFQLSAGVRVLLLMAGTHTPANAATGLLDDDLPALKPLMLKRRTFLIGGLGAVGALVVGWSALPPRQRLVGSAPLPVQGTQVPLNGWVKVSSDNSVTVMMCKAEMGQGIYTGAAMLLAEEMDADWAQVKVEQSPIDGIYNNLITSPAICRFAPMITVSSRS